jgi:hypothetical protein
VHPTSGMCGSRATAIHTGSQSRETTSDATRSPLCGPQRGTVGSSATSGPAINGEVDLS